jgi:Spy/CpxP family protein refolding chaperone
MTIRKRTIAIITVGTLLVGGVAACAHRIHHATPEERGEWVVEKISKKLELNEAQKIKLVDLKDEVLAVRKSMRSDREQNRAEVLAMLKQPTMDRQKVNSMVQQKIDQASKHTPEVVDAIANFYDSLDDEQRAELAEHIEDKLEHYDHHRRQ